MILTGKAKEDFYKFLTENCPISSNDAEKWFLALYDKFKNALIIEWFDTKCIFIQHWGFINDVEDMRPGYDCSVAAHGILYQFDEFELSRVKATEKAIKKANEIYNEM